MYNNPIYKFLKRQFKGALHAVGYDVQAHNIYTSEGLQLKAFLTGYNIQSVLDIGANEGQFALGLLEMGFKGQIFSFEPISSVYQKLAAKAVAHKEWHTFQNGVGRKAGSLALNVSENLASSSLLKVASASTDVDPATKTSRVETIDITTIDAFMTQRKDVRRNILLKLDIQGFELEALNGAVESIQEFEAIQVELSLVRVYEGGPLYDQIISFLGDKGYELFSITPAFLDTRTGRMLQVDGLFVRKR